ETTFAPGAAPVKPHARNAAQTATHVPLPEPTPLGFVPRPEYMSLCLSTRPPKSARVPSTPVSTMAMVGMAALELQKLFAWVTTGQICMLVMPFELGATPAFGVIARAAARRPMAT